MLLWSGNRGGAATYFRNDLGAGACASPFLHLRRGERLICAAPFGEETWKTLPWLRKLRRPTNLPYSVSSSPPLHPSSGLPLRTRPVGRKCRETRPSEPNRARTTPCLRTPRLCTA